MTAMPWCYLMQTGAKGHRILATLGRWWLSEFLALLPARFVNLLTDTGRRRVLIGLEGDCVRFDLRDGADGTLAFGKVPQAQFSPTTLGQFLVTNKHTLADVDLGLVLPGGMFFHRTIVLPPEAVSAIDAIVADDLRRRTPFKLDQVYHGHAVERLDGGRLFIKQAITRRDFVAQSAARLGIDIGAIVFVESEPDGAESRHAAKVELKAPTHHGVWVRRTVAALCASAVVLGISTAALKHQHQQALMDGLEARIQIVRTKAEQVRTALNSAEQKKNALLQLRARRNVFGLIDLLEEVSRILPTDSWLIELRLTDVPEMRERRLALVGYSAEAPSLVSIINASPIFAEASLTAPVAIDNVENRERFSLQAKVRPLERAEAK